MPQPPVEPGQRLAVRHLLDDGSATDVLGTLVAASPAALVVQPDPPAGRRALVGPGAGLDAPSAVTVPRARVVALRVVPPRRPRLRDLTIDELERHGIRSAAAADRLAGDLRVDRLGDWALRSVPRDASDLPRRRVRSAVPLGDPGRPLAEAVDQVALHYAALGLPACIALPLPTATPSHAEPLGAELLGRGWAEHDPCLALAGLVDDVLRSSAPPPAGTTARITPHGEGAQRVELVHEASGDLLARGTVAATEGLAGLFGLQVGVRHRGQGLGRALVGVMVAHARSQGADRVHSQVDEDDAAARGLCESLGLRVHHRSVHLEEPGQGGQERAPCRLTPGRPPGWCR